MKQQTDRPEKAGGYFCTAREGGTGYIVIDAVTVDSKYPYMGNTTSLDKDSLVPQFKQFAERVREAGSVLIPQIIHAGPESICGYRKIAPLGPSANVNANCHVSRPVTVKKSKRS